MPNKILLGKAESILRCINRIHEEAPDHQFPIDFSSQDALVLNLLRACEQSIDAALHIIRIKSFDLPKTNRESFDKLAEHDVISDELALKLKNMTGFRNIAVDQYQKISSEVMTAILQEHLVDLTDFADVLRKLSFEVE